MAPTGGAKDEKPPTLKKISIPDSSLLFKGGKIQFEFDEFLQLKDLSSQLVITPMLPTNPKVTIHKKKLTINLPDSLLLPNTTYKISFGNAVQDLHEGNPVTPLHYTFSTGAYFDSLSLQGKILDAATGKPDTASWVMLYAWPTIDSVFYKQKPLYVQKSKNGLFRFENLPNKKFAIYSLQETNNNLKYDAAGEKIAFYENTIQPSDSSLIISLYSFIENEKIDTSTKKLKSKTNIADTKKGNSFSYSTNIDTSQKNKRVFDINDSIVITFNDSISTLDKTKIRLFQGDQFDATANIFIEASFKKIIIKTDWLQDATYSLTLLKSFAENKQQIQAIPSRFTFKTKKESDYGFVTIITDINQQKMISLYKDDKLVDQKYAQDTLVKFTYLNPGNYQIRLLDDANLNGVWDTGNLHDKQLPELVTLIQEPIAVKANWGNKINLKIAEQSKKPILNK
ncbi:MAG: Ig-like domain-containing protein [Bacteroidetes bacterium]|jgi:hypothetical protein|nr:Ig-like domain-containing protein [Bacteroidota bacterium]MBK7040840.1 Ig-like domain-containing protein [Bacteroidota bacterium]MBK7588986.1 Ig-like domain-containing protein [Bacteroidota bacterium]MBK8329565.1 Ig-like domain-containing protein [Bacteroidota bacterium]MBK9481191.1 Ig-like domain-containing protein [Bacteroidota bacterium]